MSRATTYLFPALAIGIAALAGVIGGVGEDTNETRAVMFAIVAALFAAELASMVARTKPTQWDGLTISMAAARASIVHYFASLALQFGGLAVFPEWWWTAARTFLGVAGGAALVFMLREDARAFFQEMNGHQRRRAIAGVSVIATLYVVAAILW